MTTRMARQASFRTGDIGGEKSCQWPDIAEVPESDQSQPSASCWAEPHHEVGIGEKTPRTSQRRDEVTAMVRYPLLIFFFFFFCLF